MAEAVKKPRPEYRNIGIAQLATYRLPLAGRVSILHRISGLLLFVALPFLEGSEEFERHDERQQRRYDQHDDGRLLATFLAYRVVGIEQQEADAGTEVKQEGPRKYEDDDLDEGIGEKALEGVETDLRRQALVQQIEQKRQRYE